MILILRHQESQKNTNVLTQNGVLNSFRLADAIKNKLKNTENISLLSSMPYINDKHIRPLQTCSLIGTRLEKNVNFTTYSILPTNDNIDHVIIWHHNDIENLVQHYFPNETVHINWKNDDYDSCVLINSTGYEIEKKFISKYTSRLSKVYYLILKIILSCR